MAKLSLLSLKAGETSKSSWINFYPEGSHEVHMSCTSDLWRECVSSSSAASSKRSPLRTDFSLGFFLCARMNIWIVWFFFFKIASVSCFPAVEFLEWDHLASCCICVHMCVVCPCETHNSAQAALKVLEAHKWEFPSRKHFLREMGMRNADNLIFAST